MNNYKTIKEFYSQDYEVNKSQFICYLEQVETPEAAQEFIQSIKKKHYDARHNCSAYIIGERGELQKANDDGEPSGTAGIPMLEVLKKQELTNIVAVVTRYFGGIKLGAGGLIRAYGKSVSLALADAPLIQKCVFNVYKLHIDYSLAGTIENLFRQDEIAVLNKEYTHEVTFEFLLKPEQETMLTKLTDLTAGKLNIEALGPRLVDIPVTNK